MGRLHLEVERRGGREEGGEVAGWRDAAADEITQTCGVVSHLSNRRDKGMQM